MVCYVPYIHQEQASRSSIFTAKFLILKKAVPLCFTSVNDHRFGWLQNVFLNYY